MGRYHEDAHVIRHDDCRSLSDACGRFVRRVFGKSKSCCRHAKHAVVSPELAPAAIADPCSRCTATLCDHLNVSSVAINGLGDYAAAQGAAVAGGYNNQSCDTDSTIAGGADNIISGTSNAAMYATIAGGIDNQITSGDAFIGGGDSNIVSASGGAVGGGDTNEVEATDGFIGGGTKNVATNDYTTIAGGSGNSSNGYASFLGAGEMNSIAFNGSFSTIAGGVQNSNDGQYGFIGGGAFNSVQQSGSFIGAGGAIYASSSPPPTTAGNEIFGTDSFLGAGDQNTIGANEAFVGSGSSNSIAQVAAFSVIAGGAKNAANSEYAAMLGGYGNTVTGEYGIVPGGNGNTAAGELSFAAGYHADAVNRGSFVWSDFVSGSALLKDTAANQFVVRSSGGTYVYSNEGETAGVKLGAGSGSWASLSDRNAKTDIGGLDDAMTLEKVAALPIHTWRYSSESGVRHVGPMAQDFYAAFGVGEDDRHITAIDEDGVAFSAIKALRAELERKDAQIAALSAGMRRLDATVATLVRASQKERDTR